MHQDLEELHSFYPFETLTKMALWN